MIVNCVIINTFCYTLCLWVERNYENEAFCWTEIILLDLMSTGFYLYIMYHQLESKQKLSSKENSAFSAGLTLLSIICRELWPFWRLKRSISVLHYIWHVGLHLSPVRTFTRMPSKNMNSNYPIPDHLKGIFERSND